MYALCAVYPIIYRPPDSMIFNQVKAVTTTYIFADNNASGWVNCVLYMEFSAISFD